MHSSDALPAASGAALLLELGRLIVRSRSASPAPPPPRDRPRQIQPQPVVEEEPRPGVEALLNDHVQALWTDQIPICIEVLLAGDCSECRRARDDATYDKPPRGLLLERWTLHALPSKPGATLSAAWLLGAVRSQLHFSQLSAWRATIAAAPHRRKISRETCNIKKLEANCDDDDLVDDKRRLNIVYSIRTPGDTYHATEFQKSPVSHQFPITDIGNNVHLKIVLESLPRVVEIPTVKCTCQKRRASKEIPVSIHEELTGKLNDLSLGNRKFPLDLAINSNTGTSARRLSIVTNTSSTEYLFTSDDKDKVVDDRMLTPCSENGKHKCSCDDESDGRDNKTSTNLNETKKLDERRLKEIAKYKRRLRKESKLRKLCDSTSSEGDTQKAKETHTSIPILQAARFDRFRAIGCYRNQTYLTLPATRIESKSPFIETANIPPIEIKKTCTASTQTEDICPCGSVLQIKCDSCNQNRLVRSEANYNLASIDQKSNGARRKCEDEEKVYKKPKCDNNCSNNIQCDNIVDINNSSVSDVIKRPKLRRIFPISDRLDKVVSDRSLKDIEESHLKKDIEELHLKKDIEELHLKKDDSVFSVKPESKRQKTFSINDEYVPYEKCDYGTFDNVESDGVESPIDQNGFMFPDVRKGQDNQVPSPSEMDKFRWRFDSAASMVFHSKTGLPLTSSPAPLRRGNNCFDFDDSINGISGIKSALFHPISAEPPPPCSPTASSPPSPAGPPRPPRHRVGTSTGLLGSFEESALKGRLEPVATVAGFTAELGAMGSFCPPHRKLPVTVFFYAPGGTNAPYMGHINLGPSGYRVARSGTIQVSLFNPHGTLVKMFVVLYDLTCMPPRARTFLRQRTLYLPATAPPPPPDLLHKWLRYLIHLRFMTSKSGKLYLHTDIRIIVSRKADLDTATAHSVFRPIATKNDKDATNCDKSATKSDKDATNATNCDKDATKLRLARGDNTPNRVFGGSSDFDSEVKKDLREIGYDNDNQNGVSYELRSFTYAPENPKYSPR